MLTNKKIALQEVKQKKKECERLKREKQQFKIDYERIEEVLALKEEEHHALDKGMPIQSKVKPK